MRDFRGDTIYFIVVDRFCDGDPGNNTGKNDAQYDPECTDWEKYWGGDLQGIITKLQYIQGLGASAIWITPVFDQVDGLVEEQGRLRAPYHGYWAKDFKRIDEHLVNDPEDVREFARASTVFDRLVGDLHARGMRLILDIVCNHSSPHTVGGRGVLYDDGQLVASYDQDRGDWYHHMGEVRDWRNLREVQNGDLCGLSDFNEESYAFRRYIKESIGMWLDKGVDALRVDTVKHMPLWFWQEFVSDIRKRRPGVFMFGEWFLGGAYDNESQRFARLSGMTILDFSFRQAIEEVLARDVYRGFEQIADLLAQDHKFDTASELVTFVDNHDLPRFLSVRNDPCRFRMANILIMTARGIPCIYYGSEQLLHNDTHGGNDPYNRPMMTSWDTNTTLYKELSLLADLRKRSIAVQKGGMFVRHASPQCLVFTRQYLGSSVVVAMNKGGPSAVLVSDLPLPNGTYRCMLTGRDLRIDSGKAQFELGENEVVVLENTIRMPIADVTCEFQLNGLRTRYGEEVYLTGDCPELGEWDVSAAVRMEYVNANCWCVDVPFRVSCGKTVAYKYLVRSASTNLREGRLPKLRAIPSSGCVRFRDDWPCPTGEPVAVEWDP